MLRITINLDVARLRDLREMLDEIAGRVEDTSWGGTNALPRFGPHGGRSKYSFAVDGEIAEKLRADGMTEKAPRGSQ